MSATLIDRYQLTIEELVQYEEVLQRNIEAEVALIELKMMMLLIENDIDARNAKMIVKMKRGIAVDDGFRKRDVTRYDKWMTRHADLVKAYNLLNRPTGSANPISRTELHRIIRRIK